MNVQRFTEKSQQALIAAQDLAGERNNSQVEEEHLLASLLDQPEGLVPALLERAGTSPDTVRRENAQLMDRLATAYGSAVQPAISPELRTTLVRAHDIMADMRDEYVSVEHVVLAMVDARDNSTVARMLRSLGITKEKLLSALATIRGGQRVMDRNPEGKYQALEKYGRNLTDLARLGKLDP